MKEKTILVTGCAGFIASNVVQRMCELDINVIGIDNMNNYYDVKLKEWRLNRLKEYSNFCFKKIDIEDYVNLDSLFKANRIDAVVNLAARAGVRYSVENPRIYLTTNIYGTLNLLELCRQHEVGKFVLASTSSLYAGKGLPFIETMDTSRPISPYAATKGAAEQLCYTYHYLYGVDVTILRYFTVYGPAGRPDMSIFRFIKWMMDGHDIVLSGDGQQQRDFTYVDDIAAGTVRATLDRFGYDIFNLGNNNPYSMNDIIRIISNCLQKKAKIVSVAFPKEDIVNTCASIDKSHKLLGWTPEINIEEGIKRTVAWSVKNRDLLNSINLNSKEV